jgi:DNA primase catalytic core
MSKDVLKGKTFLKSPGHFIDEATEQVEAVKHKHSIVSLFESYGVKLAKTSHNGSYTGLCPWHDDHNPSLSVDDTKGLFHCFGCDAKGDIIELVRKMENVSFREAMKKLEGRIDSSSAAPIRKRTPEKVAAPEEEASTLPLIALADIAAYYHNRLFESKDAVQYLIKRGITNTGLYERFAIGFADGSILSKLSDKQQEALKASGILTKKSAEHFHNCIIFPILDPSTSSGQVSDRVVGLYGRRIMEDASTSASQAPKHLYLPGPHRGIWNRKASKVYDEIVLVESIVDALSLVQIGAENVQPLYGVNGFTAEHLQTLKDDNVKTIVLAMDADEAGHKASEGLKAKLLDEGFTVKTIFPKLSKDWNEELVAGLEKETFRLLIEEAKPEKKQEPEKSFEVTREGIKDIFRTEHITYEIVGAKELFVTNLRVNVKAIYGGESYYDNADLASGRSRRGLSETLAQLFSVEYRIVERDLMRILDHYANERDRKLSELSNTGEKKELTAEERELGLAFLTNPDMFDEIVRDMDTLGYVGEDLNKILLYLAASSRILDDPISVMILSQSAAGKSMLVSTLKKLIPAEDVISLTSLSDQALNYIASMLHKFLDLGEAVHSETIEHQIRDMLSAKELSRLVTIKDEKTGQMRSELKRTPAIVAAVMTTTRQNINPENASRFFVINTDETKEQTRRIHAVQREKYTLARYTEKAGIIPDIEKKHHAAQRLLRKVAIVNNFGGLLDFPDTLMRVRRDHERFIDLIACVCFLRQYRKELANNGGLDYIECDIEDYRIAYDIMINGVLASTMIELPKSATELYSSLRELARTQAQKKNLKVNEVTFTQREIREHTGYGQSWIRENMRKLVEYEYVIRERSLKRGERGSYRLKDDADIEKIDLSMIPTPEDMERLLNKI